jgi:uncharacterized iron-regulated membrane protein
MRQRGDKLRSAVRKAHLWLGLSLGGVLVLLGLTGSVLIFYPELDAAIHPEIRAESEASPDWGRALATLRKHFPDKHGPWRFEVTGKASAIPARYYNPMERAEHAFRPMMVWLAPDGHAVIRQDYWGEYAMTFIYDLHYRLLLGEAGGKLLGWLGFGFIALLVSGLWAWWPRGSWRKALRFKRHAPSHRLLRDWHKLTGLSALAFLAPLVVTGIMLELPAESDAALSALGLPVTQGIYVAAPQIDMGQTDIGPEQAVARAKVALPGARLAWIETPPASGGHYRLRMQVRGDPSTRFPHSFVWVDSKDGRVKAVQDARASAAGSIVKNWVHPLHNGSAGGLAGRTLVAIAGFVPLVLFVTGLVRWRMRRQPNNFRPPCKRHAERDQN